MKLIILYLFQFLTVLAGFFYQIVLAENSSTEIYGIINIILTSVIIFGTLGSFGIGPNILRIFHKYNLSSSVNHLFKLLIITSSVACVLFLAYLCISIDGFSPIILFFSLLLLFTRIFTPVTEAYFQITDNMMSLVLLRFYQQFSRLLAVILLVVFGLNGEYFLIFAGMLSLLSIIVSLVIFKKLTLKNNKKVNTLFSNLKTAFTFTVPYAGASIYYQLYFQVNIIIFGVYKLNEEAAYYSAVFNFISVVSVFLLLYFQTYKLPKIHQNYNFGYINQYKKKIILLSLLSIPPTLIVSLFSENIFNIVYSGELINSYSFFSFMIFFIPLRILINGFGSILINEATVIKKSIIQRYAAIISIVLGFLFIKIWGIDGAILSFFIVEAYILISFTKIVNRTIKNLRSII